jgi:hypothetical protein
VHGHQVLAMTPPYLLQCCLHVFCADALDDCSAAQTYSQPNCCCCCCCCCWERMVLRAAAQIADSQMYDVSQNLPIMIRSARVA